MCYSNERILQLRDLIARLKLRHDLITNEQAYRILQKARVKAYAHKGSVIEYMHKLRSDK